MKLSVTLPDDLVEEVRARAREDGVSVSQYVAEALRAEERRRNFDTWADEAIAESPPTEEDIARARAVFQHARRKLAQQTAQ